MSASGAFASSARSFIISSVIGVSKVCVEITNPTLNRKPQTANGHRKPLARHGAMEGAHRERLAIAELNHGPGHDLRANPGITKSDPLPHDSATSQER